MEFSINAKQAIASIWTVIAIIISLIITLALGNPAFNPLGSLFPTAWQWLIILFFGFFLVLTVPVYLLIALWHIVTKWEST